MSYWESLPFDILTVQLPYLDFEDPATIEKLSSDPYIRMKLGIDDENGHLWKFIVSKMLTRNIPTSSPSMKDRYYQYINMKKYNVDDKYIFKFAVKMGYEILVQRMAERDPSLINLEGNTPLIRASEYGHYEIVKYLVTKGAIVDLWDNAALILATQNGHLDITKYLVEKGATINDIYGIDTLWKIIEAGRLDMIKYLINSGFDIHFHNDYIFLMAVKSGNVDIMKYAVEQGTNIHIWADKV